MGGGYDFILMIPILLFSIVLHEFAHAYSAKLAGDMTATRMNRLTLNPIPHIDLVGTIIFPVIAYISHFPLFGWAKPVPVDPRQFRHPRWKVIVSLAGPFTNILLAVLAIILLKMQLVITPASEPLIRRILLYFITINLLLGLFNLLPIPPLDGSHVLEYFVVRNNPAAEKYFIIIRQAGFMILVMFLIFPPTRDLFHLIFWGLFKGLLILFDIPLDIFFY